MAVDPDKARERLLALRDEIRAASRQSEADRAPVALDQQSVGRLSRIDALQQQAMAQAAERARGRELQRIDAALRRIEEGEYGWCAECGEAIAERRLEIDPCATLCVKCAGRG
jgi:DnaK suppressor protein